MHRDDYANWQSLTADEVLTEQEAVFYGLLLTASASGGSVSVYEGRDASSGKLIGTFVGIDNQTVSIAMPFPVLCVRGIFVDVGSNVESVVLVWKPITPNV